MHDKNLNILIRIKIILLLQATKGYSLERLRWPVTFLCARAYIY